MYKISVALIPPAIYLAGFVSLVGCDKVPVTVRDSVFADSFILSSVLPFDSDTDILTPVLAMSLHVSHVPLHNIGLYSDLF